MSVRLIVAHDAITLVALYCSTQMEAFGPVFYSEEQAEDFLDWLQSDARTYTPSRLQELHDIWHNRTHDGAGEYIGRHVEAEA